MSVRRALRRADGHHAFVSGPLCENYYTFIYDLFFTSFNPKVRLRDFTLDILGKGAESGEREAGVVAPPHPATSSDWEVAGGGYLSILTKRQHKLVRLYIRRMMRK